MNIKDYKNIYMVGIGGISMSGIAEILNKWGFKVSGSDSTKSSQTEWLEKNGIHVNIGQVRENITKDIDLVVYTAAIHEDNAELVRAKELGIPMEERGNFLGELTKLFKDTIGVSGTHGKTSTTSMISLCFLEAGLDPSIQVGAVLKQIDGNYRVGNSDYFIIEACEYHESYLNFVQRSAIVTNIDDDHLDYFGNINNIINSFRRFTTLLPEDGILVYNNDDENTLMAVKDKEKKISYGIDNISSYMAKNIKYDKYGHGIYDLYIHNNYVTEIHLGVSGIHNIYNSLAAIALCNQYISNIEVMKKALNNYTGVGRRFEFIGEYNKASVYDDYAHHPSEIKTTVDSVKKTEHKESWAVFQSHTYSRTKDHLEEFAKILSEFDHIVIATIYPAREENIYNVKEEDLVKLIKENGNQNVVYIDDFNKIVDYLKENVKENDLVITIGAGNANKIGKMLVG